MLNVTRKNIQKLKKEIVDEKLSKQELDMEKEKIKIEVQNIILNFNKKKEEVMIDE